MIYSVICTDVNDYIDWQCELLEYSWARVRQPGELVRLVAAPPQTPLPRHEHARSVRIEGAGDRSAAYQAFERLFSLRDWLAAERPEGTVLILDPDCVFRRPIDTEATPGSPIAQRWIDFKAHPPAQPATWPALIHTSDLEKLLPLWISLTGAFHKTTNRWESDMFALVTAASSLGLRFHLDNVAAFVGWPDEEVGSAPIVHYCQDVLAQDGGVLLAKRAYRPWSRVSGADRVKQAYCRDLLEIVDEFAALKSSSGSSVPA